MYKCIKSENPDKINNVYKPSGREENGSVRGFIFVRGDGITVLAWGFDFCWRQRKRSVGAAQTDNGNVSRCLILYIIIRFLQSVDFCCLRTESFFQFFYFCLVGRFPFIIDDGILYLWFGLFIGNNRGVRPVFDQNQMIAELRFDRAVYFV